MLEKYKFFCVAELINGQLKRVVGFCYVFVFIFILMFLICRQQTNKMYFKRQNKLFVSLEPWALFVNILVNEIEKKTILQFKPLKMYLFFIELLP